jgi:hypothetical protein
MADFNIRSESVDVEQIMKQIRTRISEKRGVDYTEDQVRELATVRLERFLDPQNLRSDLLDQFRRSRPAIQDDPPPVEAPYEFSDKTLFASHRGGLRFMRQLLRPILKLFFNPNMLSQILATQAQFNLDLLKREQRRRIEFDRSRAEWNALYYELLHNLVLETTRNGIELKNMRMRVEALASRLDFSERRVRALEGVVQYRPEAVRSRPGSSSGRQDRGEGRDRDRARASRPEADEPAAETQDDVLVPTGEGAPVQPGGVTAEARRRRRRRRGRRGASSVVGAGVAEGEASAQGTESLNADGPGVDDDDDHAGDDPTDGGEAELAAEREPGVSSDPDTQ